MRTVLFALLLSLCNQGSAHAETAVLDASDSGRSLNEQVALLADPGAQLSVADLHRPEVQARFQPAEGKASVGQSPHPWWIRVSLQRNSDAPSQWWLEVGSVTLKDLRIYLPDGNGGWIERQSGELVSFDEGRDHAYRRMLFAFRSSATNSHQPSICAATTRPAIPFHSRSGSSTRCRNRR